METLSCFNSFKNQSGLQAKVTLLLLEVKLWSEQISKKFQVPDSMHKTVYLAK